MTPRDATPIRERTSRPNVAYDERSAPAVAGAGGRGSAPAESGEETTLRLVVGGDHAGYELKGAVVAALREWGHAVEDVGPHAPAPVDFPDVAQLVCEPILAGEADRGVMVCGTGIGACMAANKIPGIRAALCHDVYSAHQCVEHDDANVLCLGAQIVGDQLALDLLKTYLGARMSTDEYFRQRLVKLAELERRATERSQEPSARSQ